MLDHQITDRSPSDERRDRNEWAKATHRARHHHDASEDVGNEKSDEIVHDILNHGARAKPARIESALYVPSLRSVRSTEPPGAVPAGMDSARRSISVTETGRLSPKYLAAFFNTDCFAIRDWGIPVHALQNGL